MSALQSPAHCQSLQRGPRGGDLVPAENRDGPCANSGDDLPPPVSTISAASIPSSPRRSVPRRSANVAPSTTGRNTFSACRFRLSRPTGLVPARRSYRVPVLPLPTDTSGHGLCGTRFRPQGCHPPESCAQFPRLRPDLPSARAARPVRIRAS